MRRLFCILFVLLFSMLSMATKKAPLYLIDGSFETQNQLSPEQIASVTILDSAEAVDIYGERASGGVVIIRTKEFENKNYKKNKSDFRPQPTRKRYQGVKILPLIIIVLLSIVIPKWLLKLFVKARKHLEEEGVVAPKTLPPYLINAESVRFDVASRIGYHGRNAYMLVMILLLAGLCFFLAPQMVQGEDKWAFVLMFVLFSIFLILCILILVGCIMERKCYLIIDRKGIRGVYKELHTFSLFPKFKKVNIQWKPVASAEIMHTPVGRWGWVAGLAIFDKSNLESPKEIITLNLLPVQKIVDSANYFYACYQEEKSLERQELISSFDLEDNKVLVIWLEILSMFVFTSIYLLFIV